MPHQPTHTPGDGAGRPPTPASLGATVVVPASDDQPTLVVVVDTEEEFDWSAGFDRAKTSVASIAASSRLQQVLAPFGVVPTYVVDYPVADQPGGFGPLKEYLQSGQCRIGAHMHSWVTPPFEEEVCNRHSFPCNLPDGVEERKIRRLVARIGETFDFAPRVYKAGRYGFDGRTAGTLERLGFDVDVSVNPRMDFRPIEGPSFLAFDAQPFFFGRERRLLEVPCTTEYVGAAASAGTWLRETAERGLWRRFHAPGILARLGVVDKLTLSPEGYSLDDMKRLTVALVRRGVRVLTMTLHSPSLEPGHTPYVRSSADLEAFLARIRDYCQFFFSTLHGTTDTPEGLWDRFTVKTVYSEPLGGSR
jgi:hypothetical protein